jgi:hypothetical protein
LVALIGTVALLGACNNDGNGGDVRSPAPTGSLTPANATATPQGDVAVPGGRAALIERSLVTP